MDTKLQHLKKLADEDFDLACDFAEKNIDACANFFLKHGPSIAGHQKAFLSGIR